MLALLVILLTIKLYARINIFNGISSFHMKNNYIRYYISYLNLTGTVKHNSTNKSFIYCLWIPFCKLFNPCNNVGNRGKNSWYSKSWLPKTRFLLQFDLLWNLPKFWSQHLTNYLQKRRNSQKTSHSPRSLPPPMDRNKARNNRK